MLKITAGACLSALLLAGCSSDPTFVSGSTEPEATARDEGPGLPIGAEAPDATVISRDGQPVQLASYYGDGPTVVIFYRGGWCPYCEGTLRQWQGREDELAAAGGRLIAITAESPDHAAETASKHALNFLIFSDPEFGAADAFEVTHAVEGSTKSTLLGYGVDLAEWNASGDWRLPAPGTFVIDRAGVIRYKHADWDYTKRADPAEVIEVVRGLE
ncbi:MAG: redoxin domain-containing protein [Phycisphaerales bacterium JB038]